MNIPNPIKPYTETIKLALAVLLGCGLLWAGQTVLEWREAAQQNEQRGRTMESTAGTIKDGDASTQARQDADHGVAQGRDNFNNTIDEDGNNEPETAVRDSGAVPSSRLRAFEQRRLERERLAADRLRRAGVERPARSGPTDAPQR